MKDSSWFTKEILGFKKIFSFLAMIVILDLITSISAVLFIEQVIDAEVSSAANHLKEMDEYSLSFLFVLLMSVILEESSFRIIPLGLSIIYWGKSYKVFIVMILSAIIFGWLHNGFEHIFIQGFGAVIFSIVYFKTGGFNEKYFKAASCCVAAHFSFNAICIYVLPLLPFFYYH